MAEDVLDGEKRSWFKNDWVIAIAAAVIGAVATKGLDWLGSSVFPWWAYLVGAGVALLILTFGLPAWRKSTWGAVSRWRPLTTTSTLESMRRAGRAELEAELETQRSKHVIRPQWLIVPSSGEKYTWRLHNAANGSIATEVSISVDGSYFKVGSALDWPAANGGESVTFKGTPTSGGADFGVAFLVAWTDANGQRQQATVQWEGRGY